MADFREVTKEEFDAFIASYPRKLRVSVVTICQPEMIVYGDLSLGSTMDNIVASYDAWGHTPGDIYGKDPGGWRILAVSASKENA